MRSTIFRLRVDYWNLTERRRNIRDRHGWLFGYRPFCCSHHHDSITDTRGTAVPLLYVCDIQIDYVLCVEPGEGQRVAHTGHTTNSSHKSRLWLIVQRYGTPRNTQRTPVGITGMLYTPVLYIYEFEYELFFSSFSSRKKMKTLFLQNIVFSVLAA